MVFYVNCIGKNGMKEKEFDSIEKASHYYEECKKENEWNHIEITKQIKVYLPESQEEY